MPNLTGKVAIVTGSTKGIGLAIAERMINEGAAVVVSSSTASDVESMAERLGDLAVGIPCDVADPDACQRLVDEAIERLGRLDVLVNNAGLGIIKPLPEMTVAEWRAQVDVNLGGVFYLSKAALPHLSASGDGFIINVGSLAGRNPFGGGTGYNASKFGLVGMTEAMMLDLRHSGIRVSIVMPGSVDTRFGGDYPEGGRAWALGADDVASAVLHLLSYPDNAHVSRVEMRPSRPPKK